jgi:hypothetical protein
MTRTKVYAIDTSGEDPLAITEQRVRKSLAGTASI